MDEAFKLLGTPCQERQGPQLGKTIVNLSQTFSLTETQERVLNRGLTFVPTPKTHKEQVQGDLHRFYRSIKLIHHFSDAEPTEIIPFRPITGWSPDDEDVPREITEFITETASAIEDMPTTKDKSNITRKERQALKELKENNEIVIKPADKGSSIVIMDRQQYLFEAHRQLNKIEHYTKLDEPIYTETQKEIGDILEELKRSGYILEKQVEYLTGAQPRARKFYMLPKIHKNPDTWTVPGEIPPGRPIVSDCSSESYGVAEYIDHYLTPLAQQHPSYIKDTYHFTRIVNSLNIPPNAILFTMDVESLYTNIETDRGIQAVKNILQRNPDPERPDEALIKLLDLGLTKNDFEFNGEFYLQIKGTAMGKKFAPAYANIYMAEWEETVFHKCPKRPMCYYRFLDDIWGVWTHSEGELQEFIDILNAHHPSIKVKAMTSQQRVDFLDTTVFKLPSDTQDHKLATKVFFKPTDTHTLLHTTSHHPKHTFRGIVKSQLTRFHRICTREEDFNQATSTLFTALRQRGYCKRKLRHIKSDFLKSKQAPRPRPVPTRNLPLITRYGNMAIQAHKIVKGRFEQFQRGFATLQGYKVMSAYKRAKNLKDILVSTSLHTAPDCGQRRCGACTHLVIAKNIENRVTGKRGQIAQRITCEQKNVVYAIRCKECNLLYIGETGNSIRVRLTGHLSNITRGNQSTPISRHFQQHGIQSLEIMGLETNTNWTIGRRKRAERLWIKALQTKEPNGLNLA